MQNTHISATIKVLCKKRNITVKHLLEHCNLSKSFIYDLEKRKASPSCDKLTRIADFFGCSVDYLLGRAIARWRNGVLPNGETLIKIANYFNCSIDYLVGRTDNPNFSEENKITEQEYKVLSAYRQNTNMQQAVNKLLGVDETNSNIND